MSVAPGFRLGPYNILAELGRGGMGVVYTARAPRLDRQVAIKVLPPDLTRDDAAKERFLWDRVLLLNGELTTEAGMLNRLERQYEQHRSVYVGLTRAREVDVLRHAASFGGLGPARARPRTIGSEYRSSDSYTISLTGY